MIPLVCENGLPIQLQGYAAAGRNVALLQEYIGYIQRIASRQARKLEPGEGETTQAVRRRFTAGAEALGKGIELRRSANGVYFWTPETPRLGRSGKEPTAWSPRRAS